MGDDDALLRLIDTYEALAIFQDGAADELVEQAERDGWHDDVTQAVDQYRRQAEASRYLAQEVRDGMGE